MDKKKKIFKEIKLPNKITILRLILTPIIILLFLEPSYNTKVASLVLFIIACITDKIDGTIAKKYGIITKFGKFMDPLVDKILLNSLLIVLAVSDVLRWWMVLLVVSRELFIQILRIIAEINKLEIHSIGGKIKGPLQMATIITGIYFTIITVQGGRFILSNWMSHTLSVMMFITIIVSYSAMLEFLINNWPLYKKLIRKNS